MQFADKAGPDQPAHLCSLIEAYVASLKKSSLESAVFVYENRMFRSDCTDTHSQLDLRSSLIV